MITLISIHHDETHLPEGNNGTNFIPVVEQSSKKFRKSLAPMTHFYDFCGCALKALTSMSTTHIYSYLS